MEHTVIHFFQVTEREKQLFVLSPTQLASNGSESQNLIAITERDHLTDVITWLEALCRDAEET